jgi:hypothetical protein
LPKNNLSVAISASTSTHCAYAQLFQIPQILDERPILAPSPVLAGTCVKGFASLIQCHIVVENVRKSPQIWTHG